MILFQNKIPRFFRKEIHTDLSQTILCAIFAKLRFGQSASKSERYFDFLIIENPFTQVTRETVALRGDFSWQRHAKCHDNDDVIVLLFLLILIYLLNIVRNNYLFLCCIYNMLHILYFYMMKTITYWLCNLCKINKIINSFRGFSLYLSIKYVLKKHTCTL